MSLRCLDCFLRTTHNITIVLSGCKQKSLRIVLSHGTHTGSTRPSPSPPKPVPSFQPIVSMGYALASKTNAVSQPAEWRRWSPRTSSKRGAKEIRPGRHSRRENTRRSDKGRCTGCYHRCRRVWRREDLTRDKLVTKERNARARRWR